MLLLPQCSKHMIILYPWYYIAFNSGCDGTSEIPVCFNYLWNVSRMQLESICCNLIWLDISTRRTHTWGCRGQWVFSVSVTWILIRSHRLSYLLYLLLTLFLTCVFVYFFDTSLPYFSCCHVLSLFVCLTWQMIGI